MSPTVQAPARCVRVGQEYIEQDRRTRRRLRVIELTGASARVQVASGFQAGYRMTVPVRQLTSPTFYELLDDVPPAPPRRPPPPPRPMFPGERTHATPARVGQVLARYRDSMTPAQILTAEARVQYPELTLEALLPMLPGMTRNAVAGHLRRVMGRWDPTWT
jgi:hypothetical protein